MQGGRQCGVFAPITALPSRFGSGGFGEEARHFIDFLAGNGLSHWQMLSLCYGQYSISPYEALCHRAIHHIFLDPEGLVALKLLMEADTVLPANCPEDWVSIRALAWKNELLTKAYENFRRGTARHLRAEFRAFIVDQSEWILDFGLYAALSTGIYRKLAWPRWPEGLAERDPLALARAEVAQVEHITKELFAQFVLRKQWESVKEYAKQRGITLIGDIPFYTATSGFDTWREPHIFDLDEHFLPRHGGGAPPDMFSSNGQDWGVPVYNWQFLRQTNFRHLLERYAHHATLFDILRIDHFHGLVRSWAIPSGKKSLAGHWIKGPGSDFLDSIAKTYGSKRFIVEYIGKDSVRSELVLNRFKAPKVRILSADLAFLRNHSDAVTFKTPAVAYSSTHDTPTLIGWYSGLAAREKQKVEAFWKEQKVDELVPLQQRFITPLLKSRVPLVILPLQDILGLGNAHRINVPGTDGSRNWSWRFRWEDIDEASLQALRQALTDSDRVAAP